jgi:hypothetical protein
VAFRSLKERKKAVSERMKAVPMLKVEHSPSDIHARMAGIMRANPESTFSNCNTADFICKVIANRDKNSINADSVIKRFSEMLTLS